MTQWIETNTGFVNADHIVSADLQRDGHYVLNLVNGKVTVSAGVHEVFQTVLGTIVPAVHGQEALVVYPSGKEWKGRPHRVDISRLPIIGWRIPPASECPPVPILLDNHVSAGASVMILLPDQRVYEVISGDHYASMETMKADVLETAQMLWDKLHAGKTAA